MSFTVWEIDQIARQYIAAGLAVLPVPPLQKGCRLPGWPDLQITADAVDSYFRPGDNIAVVMGPRSNCLVDIDLDDLIACEIADQHLPPTAATFGRKSKPRSHWLYTVDGDALPKRKFEAADTQGCVFVLAEYRWEQPTMFPPSRHPSGEVVEWDWSGPPTRIAAPVLMAAVGRLCLDVCRRMKYMPVGERRPSTNNRERFAGRRGLVRDDEFTIRRARSYVAKCPPSLSGRGGHKAAYRVACVLIRGFGLARSTAEKIMRDWNRRCQPPWSDAELSHKLDDAEQSDGEHDDLRAG